MSKPLQLEELVRYVIKKTLNELLNNGNVPGSLPSSQSSLQQQQQSIMDPTLPSQDAMTPAEQEKQRREQENQRQDSQNQIDAELKSAKKESDFQKQKLDQMKRFKIPALQKQLQSLKGGTIGVAEVNQSDVNARHPGVSAFNGNTPNLSMMTLDNLKSLKNKSTRSIKFYKNNLESYELKYAISDYKFYDAEIKRRLGKINAPV